MLMLQLLHVAKLKHLLIVDNLMTLNFCLQHSYVDGMNNNGLILASDSVHLLPDLVHHQNPV